MGRWCVDVTSKLYLLAIPFEELRELMLMLKFTLLLLHLTIIKFFIWPFLLPWTYSHSHFLVYANAIYYLPEPLSSCYDSHNNLKEWGRQYQSHLWAPMTSFLVILCMLIAGVNFSSRVTTKIVTFLLLLLVPNLQLEYFRCMRYMKSSYSLLYLQFLSPCFFYFAILACKESRI